MATSQSTIDTITKWYADKAGKAPDAEGLNYWAKEFETNGADFTKTAFDNSVKAVKAANASSIGNSSPAVTSDNWMESRGQPVNWVANSPSSKNLSDAESLYSGILQRPGDKEGVDYWASQLASGKSIDDVTKAFKDSAKVVYQDYLTNPNSANRSNTEIKGLIDRDLYEDVNPGSLSGAERDVARTGLRRPIFENLYGKSSVVNQPTSTSPATLNTDALDRRVINPNTETVRGQMQSLLDQDSPYMQQARARAQRVLAGRGLINSTMAGTAGEDAAIAAALNIATPDAATYGRAADYNTALANQGSMYNADTLNAFAGKRVDFGNQLQLAQLQADVSRYQAELSSETSRYNTDAGYRDTVERNKTTLVNNILMTPDLSPDRKAALLEQMGMGTAAKRDANGNPIPGSGMAGAVYVIDDVAKDLAPRPASQLVYSGEGTGGSGDGGGGDGGDGGDGGSGE
jgi:hypothetical protein